jgi:acetylornithine deacetylase/succinyl-diaminopimelate desuccinylase-like protein
LDVLEAVLKQLGFVTHRLPFGDVDNLYARLGDAAPHFCFAGHTDVVPVGDGWKADPFAAEVKDGMLYGRGAADMKSAIAAFVTAAAGWETERLHQPVDHRRRRGRGCQRHGQVLEWLKGRARKSTIALWASPLRRERPATR